MDLSFNKTLDLLNNHSDTHPNITAMWKLYLETKRKDLIDEMNRCSDLFSNGKIIENDLSLTSILVLLNDRLSCIDSENTK